MYPIFYLAIIGAGCRVIGGNPGHTVFEIRQAFAVCNVKLVITEPQLLDKVQEAAKECTECPLIHTYGNTILSSEKGINSCSDLMRHGEQSWITLTEEEARKEEAAYFATSGTTGSPKYAVVSHAYFVHGGTNIEKDASKKPYPIRRLVSLPLMHAFAAPLVIVGALRCGTPTYLATRFSPEQFLQALRKFDITEMPVVPSMLSTLLSYPGFDADKLSCMREVMSAGAPLSQSLAIRFESILPRNARLIQLYGLTEAGWIASLPFEEDLKIVEKHVSLPPASMLHQDQSESDSEESGESASGSCTPETPMTSATEFLSTSAPSVGIPLPGYAMALLDPDTNQVLTSPMTLGEILVEAPHPFLAYVNAPEATKAAFIDLPRSKPIESKSRRMVRSGDIAYFDYEGKFYVVDRLKDLIKVRGWQVSPAEIESVLLHHPGVADTAVVGLPDLDGVSGELPHAFVVKAGSQPTDEGVTEEDLKQWVREKLAAYKALATVRFVDHVPRNPAGKILRRLLQGSFSDTVYQAVPISGKGIGCSSES